MFQRTNSEGGSVVVVISGFGRSSGELGSRPRQGSIGRWAGGINGGRILGEQVKIDLANLFQNRDYPVLTDYHAMFAWLCQRVFRLRAASVGRIFAGVHPAELGLV